MKLTAAVIARAMKLRPGRKTDRVVFDPKGIHHKTIPAATLMQSVSNHEGQKNLSAFESLCVAEKLKTLGLVGPATPVRGQGAVLQAFHGKAGYEACHTMPCQLVLNNQFPHTLTHNDKHLNLTYLQRTLKLFGRCTWQPQLVNAIDSGLEWTPLDGRQFGFVSLLLDSVEAVLHGADPGAAYREYARRRVAKLGQLLEQARDEPFNAYDATLLLSGLYGDGIVPADVARLQVDRETPSTLQKEREAIIETIIEKDVAIPHVIATGEFAKSIEREEWVKPVS